MAEEMTTAAKAAVGKLLSSPDPKSRSRVTDKAPTTPVSWVLAPDASATGVRDELLLMGKPWKNPAARFCGAKSYQFLVGIHNRFRFRSIDTRQYAGIGKSNQRYRATAYDHVLQVSPAEPWQPKGRQSLRKLAQYFHTPWFDRD
jgi:hypothetical protein